jgi:protein-tyrosine phosphatase
MIELACASNFRDLGGLPTEDGRRTRPGRLFRSDLIVGPVGSDAALIEALGIALVMDLRSASERAAAPNAYWRTAGTELVEFDIGTDVRAKGSFWERLRDDASPEACVALIHAIYRSIPTATAPALRVLLQRLPEAGPVLLHCAAGKDRTGFVVAMALHALGVTREAILADYLASAVSVQNQGIARIQTTFAQIIGTPLQEESAALLASVRADYLDQSFARLERSYGGADAYLREEIGLSEERRATLRNALLEDG